MQATADLRDFPRFCEQYSLLPPQKQYDVVWSLLEKTEVQYQHLSHPLSSKHASSVSHYLQVTQLRRVYSTLQQFLAFDIVSHLPDELAERVCSLLDAQSLCRAAICCRSWRAVTNKDALW